MYHALFCSVNVNKAEIVGNRMCLTTAYMRVLYRFLTFLIMCFIISPSSVVDFIQTDAHTRTPCLFKGDGQSLSMNVINPSSIVQKGITLKEFQLERLERTEEK